MIKLEKVNDVCVKPVINAMFNSCDVKGGKLFPEPYCNVFLCAKKKSGKSSVINTILKRCVGQKTKVWIFCSTFEKDPTWLEIINWLSKKEIDFEAFHSTKDGKTDILGNIVSSLKLGSGMKKSKDDKKMDLESQKRAFLMGTGAEKEPVERKEKKIVAENIFVLDDIGGELKSKSLENLVKTNRHTKSKVLISSQHLNDIPPGVRKNMDYWLVFKSVNPDKLEIIHNDADLHVTYDEFLKIYEAATGEKWSFLWIDVVNSKFRKSFNTEIRLE